MFSRPCGIKNDDPPISSQHAILFLQSFLQVAHIAKQESGDDRIKCRILEWKLKRVGTRKIKTTFILSDPHHLKREIRRDDFCLGKLHTGFARQVTCPRSDVQQAGILLQTRLLNDALSPANILPTRYKSIDEIITRSDLREHVLNIGSTLGTVAVGHL